LICEELSSVCEPTWVDWPTEATPNFHRVDDFADWLHGSVGLEQYDFVVGHSLGGLAALRLVELAENVDPAVILIETFLAPPAPFFQNLFLKKTTSVQAKVILEMLSHEKVHYSPILGDRLREVDISEWVVDRKKKLFALYGDRGCGAPEKVLNELQWSEDLSACVDVTVIPNACHFPMVENPNATLKGLQHILNL
jgi:pimeloyl-ACP methyl ester carboxylesterase